MFAWPPLESSASLALVAAALVIGGIIGWLARGYAGVSCGVPSTMDSPGPVRASNAPSAAAARSIVSAAAHDLKPGKPGGMKGGW